MTFKYLEQHKTHGVVDKHYKLLFHIQSSRKKNFNLIGIYVSLSPDLVWFDYFD